MAVELSFLAAGDVTVKALKIISCYRHLKSCNERRPGVWRLGTVLSHRRPAARLQARRHWLAAVRRVPQAREFPH
jgi:hypothetical protein